jgi:hypothetical protein
VRWQQLAVRTVSKPKSGSCACTCTDTGSSPRAHSCAYTSADSYAGTDTLTGAGAATDHANVQRFAERRRYDVREFRQHPRQQAVPPLHVHHDG